MGKNNKARRAAKQKARQRERPRASAPPDDSWAGAGDPLSLDSLTEVILSAVTVAAEGDDAVPLECADAMMGPGSPVPAGRAQQAMGRCFERVLQTLWQHGWQPDDLDQVTRRRLGPLHREVLAGMLAHEIRRYARATVDVRWWAQLADLGVVPGTEADSADRWAGHLDGPPHATFLAALELLAGLLALPIVAAQLPPPGSARPGGPAPVRSEQDERALARVRALLAKAESTEFPEEAEALSAKAQELMARHSLQRLVVEATEPELAPIVSRRLWVDAPYADAKALLVQRVAGPNRCSPVFAAELGFVTVVGHERDVSGVELLVTSLLVQANRAMLGRRSGQTGSTRSFRQSFLVSYADGIGERLVGSAGAMVEELGGGALLPVLRADADRIEDERRRLFPELVRKSVSSNNAAGRQAGRAAADVAVLDSRLGVAAAHRATSTANSGID